MGLVKGYRVVIEARGMCPAAVAFYSALMDGDDRMGWPLFELCWVFILRLDVGTPRRNVFAATFL